MKLYIGGAGNGQAALAQAETGRVPRCCQGEEALSCPAIDQLHRLLWTLLEQGGDAQAFARRLLEENPDAVVVCDEVGLGIVPLDPVHRHHREEIGRALCILAAGAERVTRVYCGIGQVIK